MKRKHIFALFAAFVILCGLSSCKAGDCNCPKFSMEVLKNG